jgi:hypothetical protein
MIGAVVGIAVSLSATVVAGTLIAFGTAFVIVYARERARRRR